VPKKAMVGVHAKVASKGEVRVVPLLGVMEAPEGRLVTSITRLPPAGLVPVTRVEKLEPDGHRKRPRARAGGGQRGGDLDDHLQGGAAHLAGVGALGHEGQHVPLAVEGVC
jgi:hypothetical protein